MSNLVLKKWESELLITSKPSVLQMDKISILYRKFNDYVIWELEVTLWVAKVLLVDQTKVIEVDSIIKWDFTWDVEELIEEWWSIIITVIKKTDEAKKKLTK